MKNTMKTAGRMIMAMAVALVIMLTVGNVNEVHAAGDNVNISVSGNTVTVSGNGYGDDITVTVTHEGAISDFFLADNMRWNSYASEVTIVNFKANGPFSFSFPVEGQGVVNFVADLVNGDGSTSQSSVKHDFGGVVKETEPSKPVYSDSVKPEPKPEETKPVETKPVEKVETKPVEKPTKPVETKTPETEKKPAPQPVYTLPEVDEEAVKKVYGDNSEKSSESTVKSESNPTTKETTKVTTRKETRTNNQPTATKKAAVETYNTTNVKSTTDAKTTSISPISPVETKKEEKPVETTLPLTGEVTEEATEETSKETETEIKLVPTENNVEPYDDKVEAAFPWWLLVIAFLSGSTIALYAKNKKDEMEAKEEVK